MNIGIIVIAYDRINSLKRLLSSLESAFYGNYQPTLIISIDKSDTNIVENYAENYNWKYGEKHVVTHKKNLGLRNHVLECGNRIKDFDALVVLEDDIVVSPNYYIFAQQTVAYYQNDPNIAGISLYSFRINYQTGTPFFPLKGASDVFFMKCAQSWGQVWIKDRWIEFYNWYLHHHEEFLDDGHLPKAICVWPKSSWLKYHTKYCIENNKYFVYPYTALSTNNSEIGTHVSIKDTTYQVPLQIGPCTSYRLIGFKDVNAIKYDGYFEYEGLQNYLKMDSEVCVDFYNTKRYSKERYKLSIKSLPYNVVKGYDLAMRPFELNIIYDIKGNGIFIYDMANLSKSKPKLQNGVIVKYIWGISSLITPIAMEGGREIITKLFKHLVHKFCRVFHR